MSSIGPIASIKRNGTTVPFTQQLVKGMQYAFFTATPGAYTVTYAADTTPPTVTSVSPANGSTNVAVSAPTTFTFSEALDTSSVNGSSFELRTAAGALATVTVSYDPATKSVTLTPVGPLNANTAYTATAKAGQVRDFVGNALASNATTSFTTGPPPSTLIGNNAIGASTDSGDRNWMNGSRFVNGSAQTVVSSMSVYVRGAGASPNNKFSMAIYSDSGGQPGTLVASTVQGTLAAADGWNTAALPATTLNANTAYWLIYNTNGASDNQNNMAYTAGTAGQGAWSGAGVTFGTWPATFGSSNVWNGKFSIYAQ